MALVVARVTTIIGNIGIKAGEAWDADHPFVKTHKDLFTTDVNYARGADIPRDVIRG